MLGFVSAFIVIHHRSNADPLCSPVFLACRLFYFFVLLAPTWLARINCRPQSGSQVSAGMYFNRLFSSLAYILRILDVWPVLSGYL